MLANKSLLLFISPVATITATSRRKPLCFPRPLAATRGYSQGLKIGWKKPPHEHQGLAGAHYLLEWTPKGNRNSLLCEEFNAGLREKISQNPSKTPKSLLLQLPRPKRKITITERVVAFTVLMTPTTVAAKNDFARPTQLAKPKKLATSRKVAAQADLATPKSVATKTHHIAGMTSQQRRIGSSRRQTWRGNCRHPILRRQLEFTLLSKIKKKMKRSKKKKSNKIQIR